MIGKFSGFRVQGSDLTCGVDFLLTGNAEMIGKFSGFSFQIGSVVLIFCERGIADALM